MAASELDPSAGILARQEARESSARTYARSLPIVPVRASGMVVEGADGRRYLDCLSGAGLLALGHNHPVVVDALRRAVDGGAPLQVLDMATPEKDAFVEALFSTLPGSLAGRARIQFCGPAGTDAVEAAMKLTQWSTGRRGMVAFTGGYHGMTHGALAVSAGVPAKERVAGMAMDVARMPFPYAYRCPFGLGGEATATVSATYVERALADPSGGVVPPAAMIVEAVQGEGGVVPAPDRWLREMRRITAERGIPLIVDEVQTGLGRTGALWAVEHSGIEPDVIVMSKAIGGGLPLAVVVYREELDGWDPGAHAGTFRGNQLAMVTGAATIRHIQAEALADRAARLGERLARDLRDLQAAHPCIGDVRGRGLMLGVEIVDPDAEPDATGSHPADEGRARALKRACLERGLIVELGGRDDTVVRMLPPLTMTDDEADSVVDRLDGALAAVQAARPARRPGRSTVPARPRPAATGTGVSRVVPAPPPAPAGPTGFVASGGVDGPGAMRPLVDVVLASLQRGARERGGPLPVKGPDHTLAQVRAALGHDVLPEEGVGAEAALDELVRALAAGAADPAHPSCAAHLLCPPLAVAVAADLAVSALNPSLDSWDQAPSGTAFETEVIAALARLVGWGPEAGGTVTTGGTESNLLGLLLARDRAGRRHGADSSDAGVAPGTMRVYGSAVAHFSLQRAAGILGLGERAVVGVPVDGARRMRLDLLEEALRADPGQAVVVGTAGTTDYGSIDALRAMAAVARRHGAWFHVDAAYGGMALCSDRLAPLLDGIDQADSVSLDLHKLGWMPAAAGVLLVRRASMLGPLARRVAYLNPADDEAAGLVSLLGHSLRTTRRSDAFKMAVTMRAVGRRGLGRMVERCHDLARHAAARVEAHPRLELEAPPVLTTVVLRYSGAPEAHSDQVNAELRRRLLHEGVAVIGRTEVAGDGGSSTRIKLTLLNPATTEDEVDAILAAAVAAGDEEAARVALR